MYKSFIILILSIYFFSACSFKSPLGKKSEISYVDCPKTLILAPASRITNPIASLTFNKNYSMNCYYYDYESNNIIFEFNYYIDILYKEISDQSENFEFIVFVTSKDETKKLYEESFSKTYNYNQNISENQKEYKDQIIIKKEIFEKGIKIFLAIY